MSSPSCLVQILLPKETGNGQPTPQTRFEGLLQELTDKFGGATSFVRAPVRACGAAAAKWNGTISR
jgi:hypothetical protein